MQLKIVTPNKLVLDIEVSQVTLPGKEGEMTILPSHTFLLAQLKNGKIRYPKGEDLEIQGGMVEVCQNQVTVLTQMI